MNTVRWVGKGMNTVRCVGEGMNMCVRKGMNTVSFRIV